MTIGDVYEKGLLNTETNGYIEALDAISMLCLYRIIQTQEEYELLVSISLSEQNAGERILHDMQSFSYFQRKKVSSPQQVLECLYKIKIHPSVWKNRSWLRGKNLGAYVKNGFLHYKEKKNGKGVKVKVWVYSKKLSSVKPKTFMESLMDEVKPID